MSERLVSKSMPEIMKAYDASRPETVRGKICHAPWTNLNFEQNGNATACCYNRKMILGRYPKQTLQEIWTGAKAQEFRDLISKKDLSRGCSLCVQQFQAKNIWGVHARDYDAFAQAPSPVEPLMPKVIEFELSNVCNLECVMCNGFFSSQIRRNREGLEPMKNPYDDEFVRQLEPFLPALTHARFLGGEPFLNPIYYKIWDLIVEKAPHVTTSITTNGTILTTKAEAVLKRLKPDIVLSCDSLDRKTYETIRVHANYEEMRRNLDVFLRYARMNNRFLGIAFCPMTYNWHTIPEMVDFCTENEIVLNFNTVVWPPEASLKNQSRAQLEKVLDHLRTHESRRAQVSRPAAEISRGHYKGLLNQISTWAAHASI